MALAADCAAEAEPLAVEHPNDLLRAAPATIPHEVGYLAGHPQQNDVVAAGVGTIGHGVARRVGAGRCRPWLNPRGSAFLILQ